MGIPETRQDSLRPLRSATCEYGSRRIPAAAAALLVASLLLLLFAALPASAQDSSTPGVASETTHYNSGELRIEAFIAKPASAGKHPAVLMIHDNQGLTDAIKDLAKQFAAAGFVAFAPDFASRAGGRHTPDQLAQIVGQLSPNLTVEDAGAAFQFLQKDPDVDAAKISTVGYGWGGWRSFSLAVSTPEVYRAVIYCGTTPSESLRALHAPILAHYAQLDFRTTGGELFTEKEMESVGKKFTYFIYPKVDRAFYVPGPQYDADSAKLAWTRTLDFLK